MTGHGWIWPVDDNGEAIGAPVEVHNVRLVGAPSGGAYPFNVTTVAHDPFGAPLELTGHDGPIPEHLRELFTSDDVLIADPEHDPSP